MNKYDWLEVITRGIGVWLVAQGLSAIVPSLGNPTIVIALATSFIGTSFVLLAPGFVGWLEQRDDAARHQGQRIQQPSESK